MPTSYYIISIHVDCISRMHKGSIARMIPHISQVIPFRLHKIFAMSHGRLLYYVNGSKTTDMGWGVGFLMNRYC